LSEKNHLINLGDYTLYTDDVYDRIQVTDLVDVEWQLNPAGGNFGIAKYNKWIKFDFNNSTNNTLNRFLFFPYNLVDEIDVYQKSSDEIVLLKQIGTVRNPLLNDKVSRGWAVELEFPKGNSTIYIKVSHLYKSLRVNSFIVEEKN